MADTKKTASILLRIPDALDARLNAISATRHIGRQDIIRLGLDEILSRFERELATETPVAPADAAAIAQARALGIDPLRCLTDAIEAHLADGKAKETTSLPPAA